MTNIRYIGKLNPEQPQATKEEAQTFLRGLEYISIDIETTWKFHGATHHSFASEFGKNEVNPYLEGLDPYLTDIVMIQIGNEDRQYIIDARTENWHWIKEFLEDDQYVKVGQNLKFEYKHFKHHGIIMRNLYCTMIAEAVLYTGVRTRGLSMKDIVKARYGIVLDKDTRLEFAQIGMMPFTGEQIEYGAMDIVWPLRIREEQLREAKSKDVESCMGLEFRFIPVLGDIEYQGMNFNRDKWLKTYGENLARLNPVIDQLNNYVIDNFPFTEWVDRQLGLFGGGLTCTINWSSQQQVLKFFHSLGLRPMDKKKDSLNAKILGTFVPTIKDEEKKQLVELFLRYAKLKQATTTFGKKYMKYVHPVTKRLHSRYTQIISTGRISSSSPNLQNIPSHHSFRYAFDAPPGYVIVNADYSGQEQIILANKSNDPELQKFYLDGHSDMHSFIASKIYPELANVPLDEIKTNHKGKRQIAKAAGFAINYGGTGYTIAKNLGISEDEGNAVYDAYFAAFPNLKNYFDKVQQESLNRGYILIDLVTRRKHWFRPPENDRQRGAIKRNALNYPIQGEAGGITKLAPILFRDWIYLKGLQDRVFITNIIHDEINVECDAIHGEMVATELERAMQMAGDIWCKTIKLRAEAAISDHWSH